MPQTPENMPLHPNLPPLRSQEELDRMDSVGRKTFTSGFVCGLGAGAAAFAVALLVVVFP